MTKRLGWLVLWICSGCFEESGGGTRDAAARVTVESLAAFADIQANLTTDPAKAGEALAKFVRTPVAAGELLAQPFDSNLGQSARMQPVAPLGIPDCLTTTGTTGCDAFTTNTGVMCEAGDFVFSGNASRTCDPCTDTTGSCTYNWDLALQFTTSDFSLDIARTTAPGTGLTVGAAQMAVSTSFAFTVTSGASMTVGDLNVCSCGAIQFNAAKQAINSSLVVKDNIESAAAQRCARVAFDASANITVTDDCVCADNVTCL